MEAKMVVKIINKKLFVSLIIIVSVFSFASAQLDEVHLFSNKQIYVSGDNLEVYLNLTNLEDYPVDLRVESSLIHEERLFPEAIIPNSFLLGEKENKNIQLYSLLIDEEFPQGKYSVESRIEFNGISVDSRTINFYINESLESFTFNTILNKKIFLKGEDISIDYSSSVESPVISAKLIFPDETEKEITLPTTIKAEQIGTYNLEVTASKEGYKSVSLIEQFGVIEKNAEISGAVFAEEKSGNIFDKINFSFFKEDNSEIFFFILIALLIFLIIIIVIVISKKSGK